MLTDELTGGDDPVKATETQRPSRYDNAIERFDLETIGRVVPIVALFLPVIGVGYRAVSFGLSGRVPPAVAVAGSIPSFAITGLGIALPAVSTTYRHTAPTRVFQCIE